MNVCFISRMSSPAVPVGSGVLTGTGAGAAPKTEENGQSLRAVALSPGPSGLDRKDGTIRTSVRSCGFPRRLCCESRRWHGRVRAVCAGLLTLLDPRVQRRGALHSARAHVCEDVRSELLNAATCSRGCDARSHPDGREMCFELDSGYVSRRAGADAICTPA